MVVSDNVLKIDSHKNKKQRCFEQMVHIRKSSIITSDEIAVSLKMRG